MLKYWFSICMILPLSCTSQRGSTIRTDELTNTENIQGKNVSQLKFHGTQVSDIKWETQWKNTYTHSKTVFWSTEPYSKAIGTTLVNASLKGLEGYEFSPIITYLEKARPWVGSAFVQHHFSIPSTTSNETLKDGNLTYYLKPKEAQFNPLSNLPQFPIQHPEYILPQSKMSILNFSFYGKNDNHILNQGHSFIFSYNLPKPKTSFYDYDDWFYAAGCPRAYTVSNEKIIEWLDAVDPDLLLNSFKKNFYERYKNYGYVVMNWEALGRVYSDSFWKLKRCFDYWHSQKPKAKLAVWNRGAFVLNRLQIESNDYKRYLTQAILEEKEISNYSKGINQQNPLGLDAFFAENVDIFHVGGYLNYPTNFGYIHHFLIQHIMNKKFYPNKTSILSWWNHQEILTDFEKPTKEFYLQNGRKVRKQIKPMVFPDAMHNASIWAHAFCDGADLWSEPYARMEDPRYLGSGTEVFDEKGRRIRTSFKPNSNAQYALQNHQNIDRWESAKWAISQNADIVDANTNWTFVPARRIGEQFTKGEAVLPSVSLYQKTPLAAVKSSADGSQFLLLVYDAWANATSRNTVEVKVNGKSYEIFLYGKYTSVVRIDN